MLVCVYFESTALMPRRRKWRSVCAGCVKRKGDMGAVPTPVTEAVMFDTKALRFEPVLAEGGKLTLERGEKVLVVSESSQNAAAKGMMARNIKR